MNRWTSLQQASRQLRRAPGFSTLMIVVIAMAVGATTAIFSLVGAVLLRPLPYPDGDRLWVPHLTIRKPDASEPRQLDAFSYPKLQTFREAQDVFTEVAGYTLDRFNLTDSDEPERVSVELVSPEYFRALGAQPAVGRLFVVAGEPGEEASSAILSAALWKRRFGADPEVVGRTLEIDRKPFTVVGVLPPSFAPLSGDTDLWLPLAALPTMWDWPEAFAQAGNHMLRAVARARPDIADEVVRSAAAAAALAVAEAHPTPREFDDGSAWGGGGRKLSEARRNPDLRRSLVLLLAAVVGVLLVACANVAGLLLTRAVARRRELAVRASLGADRGRLGRLLLGESLTLTAAGGLLGIALAPTLVRGLVAMAPQALSRWGVEGADLTSLTTARIDLSVLLFALGAITLATVLAGAAPAFLAARTEPSAALREGGASLAGSAGHQRQTGRRLLIVVQSSVAVVLLVAAGLMLRSLGQLIGLDPGFRAESVLTFSLVPSVGEFDPTTAPLFHEQALERISALSGVTSASLGNCRPVSDDCNSTKVRSLDGIEIPIAERPTVGAHNVGPGYFRTLGAPLVAGREFTVQDRSGAPLVAIVDEAAARRLWPGESAIGRRINIGMGMRREALAEVVGVVTDVQYGNLESPPGEDVFLADLQSGWSSAVFFVRTDGDPLATIPAVRAALRSVAPTVPVVGVRTLAEQLDRASSQTRFAGSLLGAFAGLALALTALGVYGVVAQVVASRRRELGLRMALGAEARQVGRMVVGQGILLVSIGTALGLAAAWALATFLESLLYGVSAHDSWSFFGAPGAVLVAATAACLLPAWRAMRLDPAAVLRQE